MDKVREFILVPGSQVAIRIQIAEGGLERGVILAVRMSGIFNNGAGPAHCHSTETGDDEEYLAFVAGIRIRTEGKHERAGGHEVWEFRDFPREFGRRLDLWIAGFLGAKGRLRGFGIGFELFDATQRFPVDGDKIVIFGNSGFADTWRTFGTIVGLNGGSWGLFGWHR